MLNSIKDFVSNEGKFSLNNLKKLESGRATWTCRLYIRRKKFIEDLFKEDSELGGGALTSTNKIKNKKQAEIEKLNKYIKTK